MQEAGVKFQMLIFIVNFVVEIFFNGTWTNLIFNGAFNCGTAGLKTSTAFCIIG